MRVGEGFQIHNQSQQSRQSEKFGQGRCPARSEHRESVFLAPFLGFPSVAAPIRLHNMHHLSCDFVRDIHHDHPLTIKKRQSAFLLNKPS